MLNRSAHQNPSTTNPGTRFEVMRMTEALMTKVNSPNVRILIGRVRKIRIGRRTALMMPRTTAVTRAETKLEM